MGKIREIWENIKIKVGQAWTSHARSVKVWSVVTIVVLSFPVIVDRLLTHQCYSLLFQIGWMKEPSILDESDWFSFLGSYLGAIGTIVIGMIAYQQSQRLGELQEQVNQMQKEITKFQMHPIIAVKKTKIKIRINSNQPITIQDEIEDHYFSVYGKTLGHSGIRYIMIRISFEDKGIIPTIQCVIRQLTWEVAGHRYCIRFDGEKGKLNTCDEIRILIDDDDVFLDKLDRDAFSTDKDAFFRDWIDHRDYSQNGGEGYNKSILALELCFTNQKGNPRTYEFMYHIRSDDVLKIGAPFIDIKEGTGKFANGTEQNNNSK